MRLNEKRRLNGLRDISVLTEQSFKRLMRPYLYR